MRQMNDLISRQAAIAEAYDVVIDGNVFKVVQVETLYGLPTIDPAENGGCWGCCCEKLGQVKHGKWIAAAYCDGTVRRECSVCGYGRGVPSVHNYCPNCGAKMERSEE